MKILLAKMELCKKFYPFNMELPKEFHPFNVELPREFHPFNIELSREFHPFNVELLREFYPSMWNFPGCSIFSTWDYSRTSFVLMWNFLLWPLEASICMKEVPMLNRIWDSHVTSMEASLFLWNFKQIHTLNAYLIIVIFAVLK